jgi:hypothetical protein
LIDSHAHPVTGQGEPLDLSAISLEMVDDDAARAVRT